MARVVKQACLTGLALLVLLTPAQAMWMPEAIKDIYENGFAKNYERTHQD